MFPHFLKKPLVLIAPFSPTFGSVMFKLPARKTAKKRMTVEEKRENSIAYNTETGG